MRLHPLPPDARCPYCRKGGLVFVRQRGHQGDLYRCTAATPCAGRALHHRRNRGACGVSAEAASRHLLFWSECPGQVPAERDMTVEYFSTRQVAERLHVPVSMVVHLLASGELSGTKVNNRWRVALPALKKFLEDARPNRTWQRKARWR